jgi:outer membrane cobalamin receptor
VLGAVFRSPTTTGTRSVTLEYAGTSQLPGYTVLGSGPSGLFGGNATLGREKARQLLLGIAQDAVDWRGSIALFYRQDDQLVDWTFATGSPFSRQANAVDLDVFGVEGLYGRAWGQLDINVGYTYLDKDSDYGSATVDASFYALNFARHRATLALRYRFNDRLQLGIDNEYRRQEDNPLRTTSAEAFMVSASLTWEPAGGSGLGVAITADNLTDDDYQQFPGTPAVGRQVSISARYLW